VEYLRSTGLRLVHRHAAVNTTVVQSISHQILTFLAVAWILLAITQDGGYRRYALVYLMFSASGPRSGYAATT
jgi:hypothetical protein